MVELTPERLKVSGNPLTKTSPRLPWLHQFGAGMLVKSADPKEKDLAELERLMAHPQATPEQRILIEQELRTMRSGIKGEPPQIARIVKIF